jgi:hypothetical protein
MKTSYPAAYGSGMTTLVPPATVDTALSRASGKAKARYPNTPISNRTTNSTTGKMKVRALTPGTSPAGS